MRIAYYGLAGLATLLALALLTLQIVGGLEYTQGQSDYVRWTMIAAMVTVAVLPAIIDATWRISGLLAVFLAVAFVAFLAYSLPASIGRIGEVKEAKALAATDAAADQVRLEDVRKTLRFADPDMQRECAGAPELPPKAGWPECRRKWGTVQALLTERTRLETALRAMGSARLGDTSSQSVAWLLAQFGLSVSEETIRKGSGMALPIGLEVAIASLLALAAAAVRKGGRVGPARAASAVPVRRTLRQHEPDTPRRGGGVSVSNRDEALADLRTLLKAGHVPPSQDWLAERWAVRKGTVSKWLDRWETSGELPGTRRTEGRFKTVVA